MTTRDTGALWENVAMAHLARAGLRLLTRNFTCRSGELDLIMRDGATLVFVEVRRRGRADFGGAAASIGSAKRRRLVFAARLFLLRYPAPPPCRFDVVAVQEGRLQWLRAAFDAA